MVLRSIEFSYKFFSVHLALRRGELSDVYRLKGGVGGERGNPWASPAFILRG